MSALTKEDKDLITRVYGLTKEEVLEAGKLYRKGIFSVCKAARVIKERRDKKDTTTTRADEIIERQGQMIVKQAEQIQRMEDNKIKLIGNLQQAVEALLEIADYADKEPFDMRDLKLIAIASDCLGMG